MSLLRNIFKLYLTGNRIGLSYTLIPLNYLLSLFLIVIVIGVDMTVEQLKVRIDTQSWHAEKFGYVNTEFLLGDIEKL